MKASEKIPLIERCAEALAKRGGEREIDFVLGIIGIRVHGWGPDDDSFTYARNCLSDSTVTDNQLAELAEHLRVQVPAVEDSGLWEPGMVRVFLSHLAEHRQFVGEVADALRLHGLHGFVAHDSIVINRKWADEIRRALGSMQVLVGLVHPGFSDRFWINQEVGWALGRAVPVFMVRMGEDPRGFPADTQWASMASRSAVAVAGAIAGWLNELPAFANSIGGRLIAGLASARSYAESGRAAEALVAFYKLTDEQWKQLDEVYWSNDQIYGCVLADRELRPFYYRHGREYPPPRP